MTRYRFPQDNTSFLYTGPGDPIRQPWESQLTIYLDGACTIPANIVDLDGNPLLGSVIFIGNDGMLPDFLGPDDGTLVLYAKPVEDPAYPLVCKLDQYIDARVLGLVGQAPDVLATIGQISAALNGDPHAFNTLASMATQTLVFSKPGALSAPYASPARFYNDSAYTWQVKSLRASVLTAPVGGPLTVSLRRADTNAVIAQVTLNDGVATNLAPYPDPYPEVPTGTALYLSVDAVGSTTPGADLSVQALVVNTIPQP